MYRIQRHYAPLTYRTSFEVERLLTPPLLTYRTAHLLVEDSVPPAFTSCPVAVSIPTTRRSPVLHAQRQMVTIEPSRRLSSYSQCQGSPRVVHVVPTRRSLRSSSNNSLLSNNHLGEEAPQPLIPKPSGELGHPARDGYSLLEVLRRVQNWDKDKYSDVKTFVNDLAAEHLNLDQQFSKQSKIKLDIISKQALAKYPFLKCFEDNWVVEDFVKMHWKYTVQRRKR